MHRRDVARAHHSAQAPRGAWNPSINQRAGAQANGHGTEKQRQRLQRHQVIIIITVDYVKNKSISPFGVSGWHII